MIVFNAAFGGEQRVGPLSPSGFALLNPRKWDAPERGCEPADRLAPRENRPSRKPTSDPVARVPSVQLLPPS